jgi:hypothetical protein
LSRSRSRVSTYCLVMPNSSASCASRSAMADATSGLPRFSWPIA